MRTRSAVALSGVRAFPVVVERVESGDRHAGFREPVAQPVVETDVAAVPGHQDRDPTARGSLRRHLDDRQVGERLLLRLLHPLLLPLLVEGDQLLEPGMELLPVRSRRRLLDRRPLDRGGKLLERSRLAGRPRDFERHPRIVEIGLGPQADAALLPLPVGAQAVAAAERPGEVVERAKAESQEAGEGPGRRLRQGRIGETPTGGIAGEHRRRELRERWERQLLGDEAAQPFEVRRGVGAVGLVVGGGRQVARNVDHCHQGPRGGERASHLRRPLAARRAGEEEHELGRRTGGTIDGDLAEAPELERLGTQGSGDREGEESESEEPRKRLHAGELIVRAAPEGGGAASWQLPVRRCRAVLQSVAKASHSPHRAPQPESAAEDRGGDPALAIHG